MTTVLLADDQQLFREALCRVISDWDDFDVVGEAENGEQAVRLFAELRPDIVLMDLSMPVMDGVEASRRICQQFACACVVILTVSEDEHKLFAAIKAGARGYILKDTPARRLRAQLRGALEGHSPLSGAIAAMMVEEYRRAAQSPAGEQPRSDVAAPAEDALGEHTAAPAKRTVAPEHAGLTAREREVLRLVAAGMTNKEIAEALVVSVKTVKKHLNNVFAKVGVTSRAQAAVYAVRHRLD